MCKMGLLKLKIKPRGQCDQCKFKCRTNQHNSNDNTGPRVVTGHLQVSKIFIKHKFGLV